MAKTVAFIFLGKNEKADEIFNFYKEIEIKVIQEMRADQNQAKMMGINKNSLIYARTQWGGDKVENRIDMSSSTMSDIPVGSIMLEFDNDESSKAKMEQIFNHFAKDGEVLRPLEKMFWNAYFGFVKDKYGILWQLNMDLN